MRCGCAMDGFDECLNAPFELALATRSAFAGVKNLWQS
jgi:hypothetical protein